MRLGLKVLGSVLAAGIVLYALCRMVLGPTGDPDAARPSDRLPLVELPVSGADNDLLAVILSGDGGWSDLDREFGYAFQERGIATLGFDCLKYFWIPREPAQVAADLDGALRYYLNAWSKRRLLLVGYSFGADWLPFLVNRLPTDLRERVRLAVLLAPGYSANVEIKLGDWMTDTVRPGALQVLPEAARLETPALCVYGTDQAEKSICPQLQGPNIRVLATPGGHHFNHDYGPIQDAILKSAN